MNRKRFSKLVRPYRWLRGLRGPLTGLGRLGLILMLVLSGMALPTVVQAATAALIAQHSPSATAFLEQGKQLYDMERFSEAVEVWRRAEVAFRASGDRPQQAITLSNLSLAYQQLGQWPAADAAIQEAIALLPPEGSAVQQGVLAQALDVQGRLQLSRGQAESALITWQQAAEIYEQQQDQRRFTRNQINQAQALQALGRYRRARELLVASIQSLQGTPDSLLKAIGLRSLGNVLRVIGDLQISRQTLEQSLAVAQAIADPQAIGETWLSLGNTARAQQDWPAALTFYRQAAAVTSSPATQVSAQLHQLSLLQQQQQWSEAQALLPPLLAQLDRLPLSRTAIYAQINLAKSLMANAEAAVPSATADRRLTPQGIAQALATAIQQAKTLNDPRAESYALGTLGSLYEQTQQWSEAEALTLQALLIAQASDAQDITYQWQWQLGRLFHHQGDRRRAIAAYEQAVKTLQALFSDLVAVNPDVQFSFRDEVEPIYREFVDLLLSPGVQMSQENLQKARSTIESLRVAELRNFFREACLAPEQQLDVVVDRDDPTAAVFYSIILSDRIELILKLPQQTTLLHYAMPVDQHQVETTLEQLRRSLTEPDTQQQAKVLSRQVYDWLIQPIAANLEASQVKTLVFVLDGALWNIPMAALYDGAHYLVEKYSTVLSPSLQLPDPKPLSQGPLQALVAGLTEARYGFSQLNYVEDELSQIQSEITSQVLLNQQFTTQTFESEINSRSFSIVHLATHGQFSSNANDTFILAWDKPINVNELNDVLRNRNQRQTNPLELLVLSACETATGDKRAALGLAGVAIQAGARSTLASLWKVDDASTALLMNQFYQRVVKGESRAEALRQAQLTVLATPEYQRPLFWAPYVLIGSWL